MVEFRFGGSGGWNTRVNATPTKSGFGFGFRMKDFELRDYMTRFIGNQFKMDLQDEIHKIIREGADFAKLEGLQLASHLKNRNYEIISESIDVKQITSGQYAGSRMHLTPEPLGPRRDDGGGSGVDLGVLYSQQKDPWDYGFEMKKKEKYPVFNTKSFRISSRHAKWPILQKKGQPFQFPGIGGSSPIKRYDFVGIAEKYFFQEFKPRIRSFLERRLNYG